MSYRVALSAFILLCAQSSLTFAQEQVSPTAILTEVYNSETPPKQRFTDQFLQKIPLTTLSSAIAGVRGKYGKAIRAEGEAGSYHIITEKFRVPATMSLNSEGRITSLFLRPGFARITSSKELLEQMKLFPGTTALLLTKNDETVLAHNADKALAVGSAFKLAVLVALQDAIETGKAKWSDVIELTDKHISLPSGILQDMPVGAPVTLHTLAALMISRSDNTATDMLIHHLGRQTVEAIAAIKPMLTTREMFQLKADPVLYNNYVRLRVEDRRAFLHDLASARLPDAGKVTAPLRQLDEWYIPLERICNWLARVQKLDLMLINPGLAVKSDWQRVAYKGGSNVGVLNYSTWFKDKAGDSYCLAATWNTADTLQQEKLTSIYTGLIELIRRGQVQ
ncbi:MAG: serine hydrolase [Pseudomonadota bacterium]